MLMKTQMNIADEVNSKSLLFCKKTYFITKPNATYVQYELERIYFNTQPILTAT